LTEAERKEWRAVAKANPHVNSDGYSSLLETYVGAVCRRREAAARLREEGLTVETAHGSPKPHPCIAIVQGAESAIASLSVKLALAASTRKEMPKAVEPLTLPPKRPGLPGLRLA
jgi:P27 family predicted phage terminase small subunit